MIEIRLNTPVQAHGKEVDTLRIREPKGRDCKKIGESSMSGPFKMILDFAAILADVPPSSFDEMAAKDVQQVMEVVGPFLGESPAIGRTS